MLELHIYVQSGAKQDACLGLMPLPMSHMNQQTRLVLKLAVRAPAQENAANKAVCALIARWLGIAKNRVRVISGQQSRHKCLLLDIDQTTIHHADIKAALEAYRLF